MRPNPLVNNYRQLTTAERGELFFLMDDHRNLILSYTEGISSKNTYIQATLKRISKFYLYMFVHTHTQMCVYQ